MSKADFIDGDCESRWIRDQHIEACGPIWDGGPVIIVERDSVDGGYVASAPELPGCHAQGETVDEAIENIRTAIIEWQEAANSPPLTPPLQ